MQHTGMKKGSKAKVNGSWGVYDCYKKIRKNGWKGIGQPVTEKQFYAIIRGINMLMADNIANGITVKLPFKMGVLELRKYQRGVSLVDGKLKNTYPIDWHNTLLLWEKDEEARRKRIRLRHENEWVYHVRYDKWKAGFNNKVFYQFTLNTFIKRALSKNIKSGKVDTLW
jgi:hypothetical protein